jgi:predicted Zn-dependent protease with MMP-like domain
MGAVLPDKITIWKGTIERSAQNEAQIPSLVRRVVWHEIGHHLGFDEGQIQKLEEKWAKDNKI